MGIGISISIRGFGAGAMLCAIFLASTPARAQDAGKDLKIAAVLKTLANPYWQTTKEGIEAEAKAIGATVITTVGDDSKAAKAKELGADHVINYRTDRFEGAVRKITTKKGVDVVFEHVGAETFNGSLLCLKRGGRLVTCGSTSGPSTTINLMQLFQQQYRIIGSFGASMRNIRESLAQMANGLLPVIDTEVALADFERGLARIESRQVFGKIVVTF